MMNVKAEMNRPRRSEADMHIKSTHIVPKLGVNVHGFRRGGQRSEQQPRDPNDGVAAAGVGRGR